MVDIRQATYPAKIGKLNVLQLDVSCLVTEDDAAGGDGHVLKRVLAVVAESGSLDGSNLETDLEPVDDQSG